ncbi:ATP-binding protein [Kitasatospora sp. NBC_00374]|uniref:ATP-binding protein n=1 Tax=Kitasatospora sp. NBC_00374 TaxID=2975964 RepID=UPI0030E252FB
MIRSTGARERVNPRREEDLPAGSGCWLPRSRRSAGQARSALRSFLLERGHSERFLDVGQLVLSELVTNAVEHARTPGRLIAVKFEIAAADQLRIEVHDASDRRPVPPTDVDVDVAAESGRGLWLVERLAVAWGCSPRPGGVGKFVWAVVGPVEGES